MAPTFLFSSCLFGDRATTAMLFALSITICSCAPIASAFIAPTESAMMLSRIGSNLASNARQNQACSRIEQRVAPISLHMSSDDSERFKESAMVGVIDLTEEDNPTAAEVADNHVKAPATTQEPAPFLSQGELSDDPNLLNPDFSDAKQNRVIIYIVLSLIPVLFLVPLMLGSRDLIPLDLLPPVQM